MDAAARALAEPTRRQILGLVKDEERTVSEIAEHFTVSRPAISQHLRVLQDAELVTVRTEGTRRFYQARPEGLVELARWMTELWGSALEELAVQAGREHWNERKKQAAEPDRNTEET